MQSHAPLQLPPSQHAKHPVQAVSCVRGQRTNMDEEGEPIWEFKRVYSRKQNEDEKILERVGRVPHEPVHRLISATASA